MIEAFEFPPINEGEAGAVSVAHRSDCTGMKALKAL